VVDYHIGQSTTIDDVHLSWINIELLGRKSDAADEYRSNQMNIICCRWKSSVADKSTSDYDNKPT
jgi:hypothetical protein